MGFGWGRLDWAAWERDRENRPGPWVEIDVVTDLRFWDDPLACGGRLRPSIRELGTCWKWKRSRVHAILKSPDRWQDPGRIADVWPNIGAQMDGWMAFQEIMKMKKSTGQRPDSDRTATGQRPDTRMASGAPRGPEFGQRPDSDRTATGQRPDSPLGDTRVFTDTYTDTNDEEEHMSDRLAAAKRQSEQDEQWESLCTVWDSFKSRDPGTTARRLKRTRGQGAELWKMRTKRKLEDLKAVIAYIESGATSHALNFRDDYDTQPVNVRRNLDKWADMARDCADGLTVTTGGAITAEAEKAWAAVLKAIPKSHRSPTKVSEDPARNAAAITAMRAVGVQNIRRANHFDQRAMKPAFCEAYAIARRER